MYTKSNIIRPNGDALETLTFGPVSVKPELHGRGLGAKIIRHGLAVARELGHGAVIILGHPAYYPRFGFKPASEFNLTMPDDSAFDAFMALELRDGYLGADGGKWYEDKVFEIDQSTFEAWNKEFRAIDDYIAAQVEAIQPLLKSVAKTLRKTLPTATEKISWRMPTFWKGQNLIHFAAQKNHLGVYPGPEAIAQFAPRLTKFKTSKGAIQIPYKDLSEHLSLITDIASWCGRETDNG
jgi:uncharacterized protein YdhG (YjbR/CyaY superfamily)